MKSHTPQINTDFRAAMLKNPQAVVTMTIQQLTDICAEECDRRATETFNACKRDISAQILAAVLDTLSGFDYRWGKKRLQDFIDRLNFRMSMFDNPKNALGKSETLPNTIEQLKQKHGIDVDALTER